MHHSAYSCAWRESRVSTHRNEFSPKVQGRWNKPILSLNPRLNLINPQQSGRFFSVNWYIYYPACLFAYCNIYSPTMLTKGTHSFGAYTNSCKGPASVYSNKWMFPSGGWLVGFHVSLHVHFLSKLLITNSTLIRPFSTMGQEVRPHIPLGIKLAPTDGTLSADTISWTGWRHSRTVHGPWVGGVLIHQAMHLQIQPVLLMFNWASSFSSISYDWNQKYKIKANVSDGAIQARQYVTSLLNINIFSSLIEVSDSAGTLQCWRS